VVDNSYHLKVSKVGIPLCNLLPSSNIRCHQVDKCLHQVIQLEARLCQGLFQATNSHNHNQWVIPKLTLRVVLRAIHRVVQSICNNLNSNLLKHMGTEGSKTTNSPHHLSKMAKVKATYGEVITSKEVRTTPWSLRS
jgi:hypothetical protein